MSNKTMTRPWYRTYTNPDQNKIYHVWHICVNCNETFQHTQASWDNKLRQCSALGHEILNFSTNKKEVTIP